MIFKFQRDGNTDAHLPLLAPSLLYHEMPINIQVYE